MYPVVPFFALWIFWKKPAKWISASLVFTLGVVVSLLPWMLRSITTTRSLTADPEPSGIIYRFASTVQEMPVRMDIEPGPEYDARVKAAILQSFRSHPWNVIAIITAHYWNNHLATFFTL